MVHVTGFTGMFEFEAREAPNPTASTSFAKLVVVGALARPATPTQIRQALRNVPIDNRDRGFNCQTWIESALKALKDH
ncbi:hypothetical protein CLAFUW4_14680 [Fulvia fulva]|uniref:Uncharacterized protein n=1 Tax=Passalora fulva TaxID=5499 RepID=A0A9Q8PMV7_PASFU|nr:uncharacterized protein CLAFUR5_14508 [Fulvia fulva]KAK4609305.1 hypothetical protein CLAFUR4_14672 [Fulvia fulva]KAK4609590.1 hypothetical protein CLAFUR0_14672 [Fulvia fulva]UJO25370.1 hypothetical protein CLAFUR5_14508 [Fulvia fulva]WPV22536.1 hypothetical protein CLAFUW4_14680 [Fulvia fulva]WPV37642.1 hypothetical protein CLAFUW7_14681 [Fulvia fulva]